jgi:SOS-response transcriptional repressor LexA
MLGEARGGSPRGVGHAGEEKIPVPPQFSRHNDIFAVKVNGMSMKGYGVLDGDYVTVLRQDEYQDGDMVVAIFGSEAADEAVVKVLRLPDKGDPYLESSDRKDTEDLQKLGEFKVQGKVVGLVRWKIERAPRRRGGPPLQPPSAAQDSDQPVLD